MRPLHDVSLERSASDQPGPQTVAENRDTHERVLHLMKGLPENQQEVVRLKFQNGLSYKEIATVTELTVSNVGYLLHTALQTLRLEFSSQGE